MLKQVKAAVHQFFEDACTTQAAALAYYTIFAMPPLLYLLVTIVSLGMSTVYEGEVARERAETFLQAQAANLIGDKAAAAEVGFIIDNLQQQEANWWKSLLSLAGILAAATGLVASLQTSLNQVWRVKPTHGSLALRLLLKRLFSLAMIMAFGFLLLVSFVVTTILHFFGGYLARQVGMGEAATVAINQGVSFLLSWALFAITLQLMPDAKVRWAHAVVGALVTVILFSLGRFALFYYINTANPAEQLGSAAASLIVILLWVYYSSICLLFGAELAANMNPQKSAPESGAIRFEIIENPPTRSL